MQIFTVVYVGSGVLHDVDTFTSERKAKEKYAETIEAQGYCIEDFGFTPERWAARGYEPVTEVNGRHYYVKDDDCLEIHTHDRN